MDNDRDGQRLAREIKQIVKIARRADLNFKADLPAEERKDWNDVLKAKASSATRPLNEDPHEGMLDAK